MVTTKVFTNGGSQAVRIPMEYRFSSDEVYVNRIGDTVLLTPVAKLKETVAIGAAYLPDDFMEDGRPEPIDATWGN